MREYIPFAVMEQLLLTAITLPGSNIKTIAAATDIQANTLYKWKTTPNRLSPEKADKLLLYFMEQEPQRLELADYILQMKGNPQFVPAAQIGGLPISID